MIVYLTGQGSEVIKEGSHLRVKNGDKLDTIFTHKVSQLVLFGNISFTHGAIVQLMRYGVDTVFLSKDGKFLGRLELCEPKNIFLRKKQFALSEDKSFALRMAKTIVTGKLANLITVLMRVQRTKDAKDAREKANQIKQLMGSINEASSVDSVRGYEGRASALYFSAFNQGFTKDQGFRKRVRRPPTDPVNSLLSLLYTFLMNRVYSAVRLAYLDPFLGNLHTLDYGRYSLVLDLMEEFRPIIADTLVYSLFNLNILNSESFEVMEPEFDKNEESITDIPDVSKDPIGLMTRSTSISTDLFSMPEQRMDDEVHDTNEKTTGKYPVKIKIEFLSKVIDAFEKKLTSKFFHAVAGRELSYAEAINFQASIYRKVIEGELSEYQPLLLR